MPIKALMVDVDGVLVDGRPEDGLHWQAGIEHDLGFPPDTLHEALFAPHWEDIITGRAGLMERLEEALQKIAPEMNPETLLAYWFTKDSRVSEALLTALDRIRAAGVRVYLATNQEHLRAAFLMEELELAEHVDGIFYSAQLGVRKPDEDFFAKVQQAVALHGAEILLVDDSDQNVAVARRAGWQVLHWTKESSPEHVRTACGHCSYEL